MGDLLTEQELLQVTKVPPRAKNKHIEIAKVLDGAGIHYWWSFQERQVVTTWHHVHHAMITQQKEDEPDFSALG